MKSLTDTLIEQAGIDLYQGEYNLLFSEGEVSSKKLEKLIEVTARMCCENVYPIDAKFILEKLGFEHYPVWEEHEDYAYIMSAEEWEEARDAGSFIPYDGHGYWAKEKEHSNFNVWDFTERPEWATHVAWYNR